MEALKLLHTCTSETDENESLSLSEFKITATKQRTKAIWSESKAAKLLTNVYNIDVPLQKLQTAA